MPIEPKLEAYLSALDKSLGPIPVSDRADIITEIKSHILAAQEKDSSQSLNSILASLGEAETVANRYLLERGLAPGKPSKSPMVKWLTIGFLGTMAISCLTMIILVWKFSPLISIDAEQERVSVLGGLISIDGKEGRVQIGSSMILSDEKGEVFEGARPVESSKFDSIEIPFNNGKINLNPSPDNQVRWRCKASGGKSPEVTEANRIFKLSFENFNGMKCQIDLPPKVKTLVRGTNGKISVWKPQADLQIVVANGKIGISPDPSKQYKFETHVKNGRSEDFESSKAPNAIQIKVSVGNGLIDRED